MILSLFFGYHDSSLTVADESNVLLHLEAERYFRRKHCRISVDEMEKLIAVAFEHLNLSIDDVQQLLVASLRNPLGKTATFLGKTFDCKLTGHHENHIGTVQSAFNDALVVVADGGSEDGTTSLYLKHNNLAVFLECLDSTIANGKFYGSLTQLIVNPDFKKANAWYPGKTMGLAAYGSCSEELASGLKRLIPSMLWEPDRPFNVDAARALLGISSDYSKPWLDKRRVDLATTGQKLWQSFFVEKLKTYRYLSGNIALCGGCALNVLLASELVDTGLFDRVYIPPVPNDAGQSVGAVLYQHPNVTADWPFLGRGFGDVDIVPPKLVDDLLSHNLIGWYQGRSEVGPRALGHRSVLGLPDSVEQRDRMNRVKGREPYRPVAPIVPLEKLKDLFLTEQPSEFMSFGPKATELMRAKAPAAVHADGTSRLQTLERAANPVLYDVLQTVDEASGVPALMNTSFNFDGEPIVDTPDDALQSFRRSGLDVLYINGERYTR